MDAQIYFKYYFKTRMNYFDFGKVGKVMYVCDIIFVNNFQLTKYVFILPAVEYDIMLKYVVFFCISVSILFGGNLLQRLEQTCTRQFSSMWTRGSMLIQRTCSKAFGRARHTCLHVCLHSLFAVDGTANPRMHALHSGTSSYIPVHPKANSMLLAAKSGALQTSPGNCL